MIKDILVCLEGSGSTQRAIDLAVIWAKAHGARIVGLAVVDEPDIRAGASTGIGNSSFKHQRDDALLADAHIRTRAWLSALEQRCAGEGIAYEGLQLVGRPADVVLTEMNRHDLAMVGVDANFLFETRSHDRHTRDAILHQATKPVVVVPDRPLVGSRVIAAAYDGSSASKRALAQFVALDLPKGSDVHVLSVDDDGAEAWETATKGTQLLAGLGVSARAQNIVSTQSIAQALLHKAAELNAGLLVMGAYASSRIKTLLWGSVTREMVENAAMPLFLHH